MLKKIFTSILMLLMLSFNSVALAANCGCPEKVLCQEHLEVTKKACVNTVTITNYRKIICKDNVLAVTFDCKFFSKCARAGDTINFTIPQALYTCEGTAILPACTKIIAEITNVQQPKWFNKNARVRLLFKCIVLPDGRVYLFAQDRSQKTACSKKALG